MESLHFYIDESGVIGSRDTFFILGCYVTDTPEEIENKLYELKTEIENNIYFAPYLNDDGHIIFHACDNHFDIRSKYYALLATLNIRAYFLVIDNASSTFSKLKKEFNSDVNIYDTLIKKLLFDRIQKNKTEKLFFTFEEYGSNQEKRMIDVIKSIQNDLAFNFECSTNIGSKSDILLSIIDYLNYIVFVSLR